MLGLSLVHSNELLFTQITHQLGAEAISPFSPDFRQCSTDFDPKARMLLELTLKACLVATHFDHAYKVLKFAKTHNYLLAIDEQIVR